ncbi:hypothetical protein [Curtobacterium aetherium]|uniref:Uncharacterized protein n=1 Tax=Curtobacterium aetherium TaxID=2841594 RepID=A0ACD1E5W5_9MICO|nr:hypothetical protein [Curtobacterium sp. L6-1]QWS34258.1 hypothetical protein KM842_03490 [Curtobacterium sp. L6-1]
MAQRAPLRPTSRIEEAIGFVGCFGLLFLGVTVFCELTGRPALAWAMTLLVTVVAVALLDGWRRRVLRRHEETDACRPPVGRGERPADVPRGSGR